MNENLEISGNTLKFNKNYDNYDTFLDETRNPIYKAILREFKKLKEDDQVRVNVIGNIDKTEWSSKFEFTKSNLDILTTVINPYFENLEEYELCNETMKLFSELQEP